MGAYKGHSCGKGLERKLLSQVIKMNRSSTGLEDRAFWGATLGKGTA